jgi:urease accessory protein UreE
VAHYALGNLHNKVLAREYQLTLPEEKRLVEELERTQWILAGRLLGSTRKDKR